MSVFLDHASTGKFSKSQLEAVFGELSEMEVYNHYASNTSGGKTMNEMIELVRIRILRHFQASPHDYTVIFTPGATGALKLLIEAFTWHSSPVPCELCQRHKPPADFNKGDKPMSFKVDPVTSLVQPAFMYLSDNDNSVLGMREAVKKHGSEIAIYSISGVELTRRIKKQQAELRQALELIGERTGSEVDQLPSTSTEPAVNQTKIGNLSRTSSAGTLTKGHARRSAGGEKMCTCRSLLVYPAQSSFCGRKYPLSDWIKPVQKHALGRNKWFVCIDATSLVATSPLDLSLHTPDFIVLSFHKIFGYPTGVGALIVRNDTGAETLKKDGYFSSGSVRVALPGLDFNIKVPRLIDRFEDGCISFLGAISLKHGFDDLQKAGGIEKICKRTFHFAALAYLGLRQLVHYNHAPVAITYAQSSFTEISIQGPYVNFNLLRSDGTYIGYSEVSEMAEVFGVQVGTGSFGNLGACQEYLGLSDHQLLTNYKSGTIPTDQPLIDGEPTGSVRASFGRTSTLDDVNTFLRMIEHCFIEDSAPPPISPSQSRDTGDFAGDFEAVVEGASHKLSKEFPLTGGKHGPDSMVHPSGQAGCLCLEDPDEFLIHNNSQSLLEKDAQFYASNSVGNLSDMLDDLADEGEEFHECAELLPSFLEFQRELDPTYHPVYLREILIYPLLGGNPVMAQIWPLYNRGLLYDGHLIVLNQGGVCLTQSKDSKLGSIRVRMDVENTSIVLRDNIRSIHIPLSVKPNPGLNVTEIIAEHRRISVFPCLVSASNFVTRALKQPPHSCSLVQTYDSAQSNPLSTKLTSQSSSGGVANSCLPEAQPKRILLISLPSIRQFLEVAQATCPELSEYHLIKRIQPNLILDGSGLDPFVEERWEFVQIGNIRFQNCGKFSRSSRICTDPKTGQKNPEILIALRKLRRGQMSIGIYLQTLELNSPSGSCLQVGDAVKPL